MGAPEYTKDETGQNYYNMTPMEEFVYSYSHLIAGTAAFVGAYLLQRWHSKTTQKKAEEWNRKEFPKLFNRQQTSIMMIQDNAERN